MINPEEVERLRKAPDWYPKREIPDDEYLDFGKMWHCFHYLLTGTADSGTYPLDFLRFGIKLARAGVDGRNVLDVTQVKELQLVLEGIKVGDFLHNLDPQRMVELRVYWADYFLLHTESLVAQQLDMLEELKAFVAKAAAQKMGLLVEAG
jgi:hypothetical protein